MGVGWECEAGCCPMGKSHAVKKMIGEKIEAELVQFVCFHG
jgi:hypothetical protein